jgi:hypothetical protein
LDKLLPAKRKIRPVLHHTAMSYAVLVAASRRLLGAAAVDALAPGPYVLPGAAEVSADTQRVLDQEVRRIVEEAHGQVRALLEENRDKLDSLATALLEHETLDEDDAYAAAGVPRAATQGADSYSAAARSQTPS